MPRTLNTSFRKRKQNKGFNRSKKGYAKFLKTKRREEKLARRLELQQSMFPGQKEQGIADPSENPTIKYLLRGNVFFDGKIDIPTSGILKLPKHFCLTDNPEDSFRFLRRLLITLEYPKNPNLTIDFSDCERISLDASICMDIILKYFTDHFNLHPRRNRIKQINAQNVNNESVEKFLFSTGTHKIISGLKTTYKDILSLDLCMRRKDTAIGAKDIDTTALIRYINTCLKRMHKKLTSDAISDLGVIIGEVIINAEEHSSLPYRYSIGYFEDISHGEDEHYGSFQFVIYNLGQTIYERLNDDKVCKNTEIVNEMKELSQKFIKKGRIFGVNGNLTEEALWTLYALQDGVSSISKDRGNGTMRFIESFLELSGGNTYKQSKLTLLSGNTKIIFDGKYPAVEKINSLNESHKIITFNTTGSLEDEPDKNFVMSTDFYFPGTMIYVDIAIHEELIK